MQLKAKTIDIATGDVLVAMFHEKDAALLDIHQGDRVQLIVGKKKQIALADVTHSKALVKPGEIGFFLDLHKKFPVKEKTLVQVKLAKKPISIDYIKKKLRGDTLTEEEIFTIVDDIVHDRLSKIEMTYFVASTYMYELSINETVALTNAIIKTGNQLKPKAKIVADKHCIGGVAGNRTTMVVVPILAAAGLTVPKTSSRSITSPAGTADTMEVLANVSFSLKQLQKIIEKYKAFMVWGGAVNLAPADDKIIQVEHPVSLDPVGQLLASILAKKKSVGTTHLLIDIPVGRGAKIESLRKAKMLKQRFLRIGKRLGFTMEVVITDGKQPIGNGIGPALEARDVLKVLRNDPDAPKDLMLKSLFLAGKLLELTKKAPKGKGYALAKSLLINGNAYEKMKEIIKIQGGSITTPEAIKVGKYAQVVRAKKSGKIHFINGKVISKIAKIAGAPNDKGAGVYLHVHLNYKVKKNDPLFTIYAENKEKLQHAYELALKNPLGEDAIEIK